MKCGLCENNLILKKGDVEFDSRSLGKILVPDLKFYECETCGEKLLSPKESDKAIDFIANKENQLIKKRPIEEFITAIEAAKILKITKQAFSKHPKIKRGLIYSTKIGDRKYYHEQSVRLFKENKNGKFQLTEQQNIIVDTQTADDVVNYTDSIERKPQKAYSVGNHSYYTNRTDDGCVIFLNIKEEPNLEEAACH